MATNPEQTVAADSLKLGCVAMDIQEKHMPGAGVRTHASSHFVRLFSVCLTPRRYAALPSRERSATRLQFACLFRNPPTRGRAPRIVRRKANQECSGRRSFRAGSSHLLRCLPVSLGVSYRMIPRSLVQNRESGNFTASTVSQAVGGGGHLVRRGSFATQRFDSQTELNSHYAQP